MWVALLSTYLAWYQSGTGPAWTDPEKIACAGSTFSYTTIGLNQTTMWLHANTTNRWSVPGEIDQSFIEFFFWTLNPAQARIEAIWADSVPLDFSRDPFTLSTKVYSADLNATLPANIQIRLRNIDASSSVLVGLSCLKYNARYTLPATTGVTTTGVATTGVATIGIASVSTGVASASTSISTNGVVTSVSTGVATSISTTGVVTSVSTNGVATNISTEDDSSEDMYESAEIAMWYAPAFVFMLSACAFLVVPSLVHRYKARNFVLYNEEIAMDRYIRKAKLQPTGDNVVKVYSSAMTRQEAEEGPDVKSAYLCPWVGVYQKHDRYYDLYAIGNRIRLDEALATLSRDQAVRRPLEWLIDVCKGLAELHLHNQVHGNLIADAVWIDYNLDTAALCDYRDPDRTRPAVTRNVDIYDLGALIEHCLKETNFYIDHGCDALVAECKDKDVRHRPKLNVIENTLCAYLTEP